MKKNEENEKKKKKIVFYIIKATLLSIEIMFQFIYREIKKKK